MNHQKGMLRIKCGQDSDSIEKLEALCREKAEELKTKIEFTGKETLEVDFWTEGMPELICTGHFKKNERGEIQYELDFSDSTL